MSHPWIVGQNQQVSTTNNVNILNKMREWNSGRIRKVIPENAASDEGSEEETRAEATQPTEADQNLL